MDKRTLVSQGKNADYPNTILHKCQFYPLDNLKHENTELSESAIQTSSTVSTSFKYELWLFQGATYTLQFLNTCSFGTLNYYK